MHQLQQSSVLGSPQETGWPQVISTPNQKLISTLAIKGNNSKNIGVEIATQLKTQTEFSSSAIHNLLLDILKLSREKDVTVQLALVCFLEGKNHIYQPSVLLATHLGQVSLKRDNKTATLLQSEGELKLLEGSLKKGDEFLLTTAQTQQLEQSIKLLFKDEHSPDSFSSRLNQKASMLVDSSLFATLLIKVKKIKTEPAPIIPVEFVPQKNEVVKEVVETQPDKSEVPIIESEPEVIPEQISNEYLQELASGELAPKEQNSAEPEKYENAISDESDETSVNTAPNKDITIKISAASIKKSALKIFNKAKPVVNKAGSWLKSSTVKLVNSVKKKLSKKEKQVQVTVTEQDLVSAPVEPLSSTSPTPKTRFKLIASNIKFFSFFANKFNPFRSFSQKDFYLEKKQPKFLKKALVLLVVIIIIAAVGFWINALANNNRQKAIESLAPAQELLDEAESLVSLDIITARDHTSQAIELAIVASKEFDGVAFTKKIFNSFINEAQEKYQEIDGQIEVSELEIFYNLREAFPNFLTSLATSNDRYLFFIDQEQKQLIGIETVTKQVDKLNLDGIEKITAISASADNLFLLGAGVTKIPIIENQEEGQDSTFGFGEPEKIKEEGDSDRDGILLGSYENFLYIYNPSKRNIYRYIARVEELSDPIGWMINKQGVEFEKVTSMAIDGQIWLTTDEGIIHRLERGEPVEFEVTKLEDKLEGSIIVKTNNNTDYLFLLEPKKQRLVVLSKNGEFAKQIASPTFASTNQLLMNQEASLAFVVSGSIVYLVEL